MNPAKLYGINHCISDEIPLKSQPSLLNFRPPPASRQLARNGNVSVIARLHGRAPGGANVRGPDVVTAVSSENGAASALGVAIQQIQQRVSRI